MPTVLRLILGDQLNSRHPWFRRVDPRVVYVMMEVRQETDYVIHHIQKVLGFFSAMRRFAASLRARGHTLVYLTLDDPDNRQSISDNIRALIRKHGCAKFEYQLPDEYRLDSQLKDLCSALPVETGTVDTGHFLTAREELAEMFAGRKQYRMETFYRRMRIRHDVLMERGRPEGGKWNYDIQNRNRYDGDAPLPSPRLFRNDVRKISRMITGLDVPTLGTVDPGAFFWPIDREQSLILLRWFVKHGLPSFGRYQDAMARESWSLFHSRLSFSLNTKMLSPREVIDAAVAARRKRGRQIGLPQVEGFVRQILGWREYIRGVYWAMMPGLDNTNFFRHRSSLPGFFWTGDTRMACVRGAVGRSLSHAYAHHIQRLMITGNFALLAGIDPAEVDRWYLGIYIDAVQWVELPNTRGMSQFADGGRIASKPYVSSANYIRKMSDYCSDCSYDSRIRHGEKACPFNSLYWDFHLRHRKKLEKNPRIGMVYRTWDRMDAGEREKILRQASAYRRDLNGL